MGSMHCVSRLQAVIDDYAMESYWYSAAAGKWLPVEGRHGGEVDIVASAQHPKMHFSLFYIRSSALEHIVVFVYLFLEHFFFTNLQCIL